MRPALVRQIGRLLGVMLLMVAASASGNTEIDNAA
jgi:hypothetical protein